MDVFVVYLLFNLIVVIMYVEGYLFISLVLLNIYVIEWVILMF